MRQSVLSHGVVFCRVIQVLVARPVEAWTAVEAVAWWRWRRDVARAVEPWRVVAGVVVG